MDDMQQAKARLESRLRELTTRAAKIDSRLRDPGAKDSEDRASERENDEVLEALDEAAVKEIADVKAALERIATGKYPVCGECGDPIGAERLAVLPYTSRCIECA